MAEGQQYSLDPSGRSLAVRLNTMLTSRAVVAAMLLCFGLAASALGATVFGLPFAEAGVGLALIFGGILAVLAWLFAYGISWRPHLPPPATVHDVLRPKAGTIHLAKAADYPLLDFLGKHYSSLRPKEVGRLLAQLVRHPATQDILKRLEVEPEELSAVLQTEVAPQLSWQTLAQAVAKALAKTHRVHIAIADVLCAVLLLPSMQTFLRQRGLREEDVLFMTWWQHARDDFRKSTQRWWDPDNLLDFSGIGLSWAAGFTPFVDKFSRPPTGSAWDVGRVHEQQVETLVNSLARRQQSNVLLVGQPGVGRLGVVKELMHRVATGKAHPALNDQRALYVHVSQLVSLGKEPAEQLSFVSRALDEMERAGNVIAVLDGLGSIVGGGDGRLDLGDILVPFFSSPTVRVVVVMSLDDYHQRIAGNQELEHLFEIIQIPPTSEEATLQLLALSVEAWEENGNVFIPYRTLREIVHNTVSILPHIPYPEKAFDVLEELVVEAQGQEATIIQPEDVHRLIARKTGVNFGRIQAQESERLLSLADIIHRRVINQEQGVAAVARAMVRARAGIRSQTRPIGSFLFLGPTGVGKTETAKALAEAYFGSDKYLQRLDMSEFQGDDAIDRLVGTLDQPLGRLPGLIAEHPFSVILLDEFEKASRSVQQLFLPLFDEGYITDARGRRYSFVHTILIATSNAGAELIRNEVKDDGKLPEGFDLQLREHVLSSSVFLPELLNRFDGVITFAPLQPEHVRQVAHLMLIDLNKRLDAKHGVTIQITDELVNYLAASGYDPQFGARPMRRLIQDTVEYWAAQQIVAGRVEPGQTLTIPVQSMQPTPGRI